MKRRLVYKAVAQGWTEELPHDIDRVWRYLPGLPPFAESGYGQIGDWAYFDYLRSGWHAARPHGVSLLPSVRQSRT